MLKAHLGIVHKSISSSVRSKYNLFFDTISFFNCQSRSHSPMTSSLRNSIHRRSHKERSQLAHRAKLGLLEKHADYVKRARDYHSKQDRLARLRQKAAERNKDEFYFSMTKEKTRVFVFNFVLEQKVNLILSFRGAYISRAGIMLLFQPTLLKFSRPRMKIMFER